MSKKMRTPTVKDLLRDFIETFCTESRDNEECDYAELMMDNHKCIEFDGVVYYVPDNNSLFSEDDELIRDLLINTYPL
jgi:hypothetical protein